MIECKREKPASVRIGFAGFLPFLPFLLLFAEGCA